MRTNALKVFSALDAGKRYKKAESFWTDGENLWSYQTCIMCKFMGMVERRIINDTHYSRTTNQYQHAIRVRYPTEAFYRVFNVPIGTGPDELRELYSAQFFEFDTHKKG